MRVLVSWLSIAIVSCVLGSVSAASAQARAHLDSETTLTLGQGAQSRELASIDSQAMAATVLYVTSVSLHVAGIATIVGTGIAGFCIEFGGGSCADRREISVTGGIIGGIAAGIGLVGMFVAIGLDVGSGRRRHALGEAHSAHLSFAPSTDGGMVALAGSF